MHQPIPSERNNLQEAAHAFARWRKCKPTKRARIPEELWELACHAAKTHGIAKASRELKLDYYRLKRRLDGHSPATAASNTHPAASKPQPPSRTSPAFVELPPLAISGTTECDLELETGQGTRVVLRWKGSTAPDLAALGQLLAQGQ